MKLWLCFFCLGLCCFSSWAQAQQNEKKKDSALSIYSITADSIVKGRSIRFADYKGKQILIVNTATLDTNFSQLIELKKIKEKQKTDLVIIVFPCNDFFTEPASAKELAEFYQRLNFPFIVGAKTSVKGKSISPIYKWLTTKSLNSVMDSEVKGTFQKFLINEKGELSSALAAGQRPLKDSTIQNAVKKGK